MTKSTLDKKNIERKENYQQQQQKPMEITKAITAITMTLTTLRKSATATTSATMVITLTVNNSKHMPKNSYKTVIIVLVIIFPI